ncbi:ribosomal protein S18-alanine N-acetyltransferase [Aeromicrobium sp. Sec7.5]|uniref:ribosomal protein S18-alanine N-acetyltransferase n=1 Tax=Aeromicrobium sp. Sec7.5 TaxID=3121276 RepID=UPI002FE482B0
MSLGPVPVLRPRAATGHDFAAVVALEQACFDEPWGPDSVAAELGAPDRIVRVAAGAGGVLGWSSTSVVAETADLLRVAVEPSARGRGLGHALVDDVLRSAGAAGATRVLLEVAEPNTAARALYAATGFREIHRRRRYYAGGADALVLERLLP